MQNCASDYRDDNGGLTNDSIDCSDDEAALITSKTKGLECPICREFFNLVENVPYVLWCGHTLCKNCILGMQWAINKCTSLPLQLPVFIYCPWCNILSPHLVYRGDLKFPRKNFFLLWMLESMNGDRLTSRSTIGADQVTSSLSYRAARNYTGNILRIRQTYYSDSLQSNYNNHYSNNCLVIERVHATLKKSLFFFFRLTTKFPLVIFVLLISFYAIPASAAILALYILITVLFALPSFLILYFAYPCLDWLFREIAT